MNKARYTAMREALLKILSGKDNSLTVAEAKGVIARENTKPMRLHKT